MKRTPLLLLVLVVLAARQPLRAQAADVDLEKSIREALGREHWYGLYLMDQKAGYARSRFVATQIEGRDAVTVRLDARMKMVALGRKQDMRIIEERIYFRTGELHSVRNRFRADGSDVEAKGVVQGDKLLLTTQTGPLRNEKVLPKPRENLRTALAAEQLTKPGTPLGTEVSVWQFEPMMLKEVEAVCTLKERKTIVLNGVQTPVSVVELRLAEMGVTSQMFIDARGVALEMQMGQAFTLRLEPEKQAKDIRFSADIVRLGCIRLDPAPKKVASLRELRLRIEGIRDDMELISDERQTWTKQPDGTRVVVSRVPAFDTGKAAKRPVADERFAETLGPSLQVQSDDARIQALSREIVGTESNAYKAAVKIRQWVYTNLRKVGTAAFSNAVETLESRQGDCTEHTVLFVALARAAGIPARMTSGVTAIEGGEGLYFHAWPEVWVGQWVAMDPTLGQDVADATHIKFTQGAMEKQFAIVSFIGRLKAQMVAEP